MPYRGNLLFVFGVCLTPLLCSVPLSVYGAEMKAAQIVRAALPPPGPLGPRYHRLRKALADYRHIATRGGWSAMPNGPLLRRGTNSRHIRLLRQRLRATNDLKTENIEGSLFDKPVELAVRRFQKRHGIAVDGVIGPLTRAVLNVSVQRRIEQLRINLERRRSIPDDLGSHYVFVNMADFVLKVVKDKRTVLTMKIVIGTPHRQTPLFSANMTYIDFNPYWNIPDRIAREEIMPRARQNANYLIKQGIRIFKGWKAKAVELAPHQVNWRSIGRRPHSNRLRQDPGPLNPLGQVKFMFPNSFEVYLHDTPAKKLFVRDSRAFSHGCIRVEQPVALATHLLPDLTWGETQRIMKLGKRRIFHLAKPIPVHLTYLTAWVNKDASVHFRKDIYGRDRLPMEASW